MTESQSPLPQPQLEPTGITFDQYVELYQFIFVG